MSVFNYDSIADFLNAYIAQLPKGGHGEASRIASQLQISSTLLSQLLRQQRLFSTDQVIDLCQYLNLTAQETDYLFLLAEWERAKTPRNRDYIKKKLHDYKKAMQTVSESVKLDREIVEEYKYIFYSHWIYAALHLYLDTQKKGRTIDDINKQFNITSDKTLKVLNDLIKMELCQVDKGFYKALENKSILKQGSPYLPSHHVNWRILSIARTGNVSDQELMITAPTSISKKDFYKVKQKILEALAEIGQVVNKSESEEVAILNVDWLKV